MKAKRIWKWQWKRPLCRLGYMTVYKKTFNPLHGDPIAKKNTTLDQILNILHPQDHEPLIQLLSQLTNKENSARKHHLTFL